MDQEIAEGLIEEATAVQGLEYIVDNLFPLRPRHDKVVCQVDEVDEKTDGGIFIPQNTVKNADKVGGTAIILAVSELGWIDDLGVRHVTDLRPGQRIVFVAHTGMVVKIPANLVFGPYAGKKLMFVSENHILATLEEVA